MESFLSFLLSLSLFSSFSFLLLFFTPTSSRSLSILSPGPCQTPEDAACRSSGGPRQQQRQRRQRRQQLCFLLPLPPLLRRCRPETAATPPTPRPLPMPSRPPGPRLSRRRSWHSSLLVVADSCVVGPVNERKRLTKRLRFFFASPLCRRAPPFFSLSHRLACSLVPPLSLFFSSFESLAPWPGHAPALRPRGR